MLLPSDNNETGYIDFEDRLLDILHREEFYLARWTKKMWRAPQHDDRNKAVCIIQAKVYKNNVHHIYGHSYPRKYCYYQN